MVGFLDSLGAFTYLAYFLLLILLYYLFRHLLEKYAMKRIERLQDEYGRVKKLIVFRAFVLAAAVICFLLLSFIGLLTAVVVVAVVGAAVLFVLTIADARKLAAILSVAVTVLLYFLFASIAEVAALLAAIVFVLAVIVILIAAAMKLMNVDVFPSSQK